ncbi:TIGR01777 family oxidoreductase [Saxibacter everestensis]|uniref:TIGR01777 family oxidoreductase n=1 Tax=Saxibacter everestensis TaxID=2909229 RepID=A0ABY8QWU0_9MICO|nr:TIGR01777 family oxidoreductase [Brevibacteriaceae bacterium ZFBP1038]
MKILVAGASGFIGSALLPHLVSEGHEVTQLVRRAPRTSAEAHWDPASGRLEPAIIDAHDVVINLAGAGVGDHRWSTEYRRLIRDSRVDTTTTLAKAMTQAARPPQAFVNASAVGYYGDRGDQILDETAPPGTGFLSEVCSQWESAADTAPDGVRIAKCRVGIVLAPDGGALARLLPLIRFGLGGPLGSGKQWWPWITLPDIVRAFAHAATNDSLAGPVNFVGPAPARNADIVASLARALRRPAVLSVPRFALRVAVGELAGDILASTRAVPGRLQESGFNYRHNSLTAAAAWAAGEP